MSPYSPLRVRHVTMACVYPSSVTGAPGTPSPMLRQVPTHSSESFFNGAVSLLPTSRSSLQKQIRHLLFSSSLFDIRHFLIYGLSYQICSRMGTPFCRNFRHRSLRGLGRWCFIRFLGQKPAELLPILGFYMIFGTKNACEPRHRMFL